MATLKEHQAAMVDLLANGSGIPASASRLAHAMHDVLDVLANSDLMQFVQKEQIRVRELNDATTPGLNDKALSKRVKELTNTCTQLRKQSAKYRATIAGMKADIDSLKALVFAYEHGAEPEQAGGRKEDTQVCDHDWVKHGFDAHSYWECSKCGQDHILPASSSSGS